MSPMVPPSSIIQTWKIEKKYFKFFTISYCDAVIIKLKSKGSSRMSMGGLPPPWLSIYLDCTFLPTRHLITTILVLETASSKSWSFITPLETHGHARVIHGNWGSCESETSRQFHAMVHLSVDTNRQVLVLRQELHVIIPSIVQNI